VCKDTLPSADLFSGLVALEATDDLASVEIYRRPDLLLPARWWVEEAVLDHRLEVAFGRDTSNASVHPSGAEDAHRDTLLLRIS